MERFELLFSCDLRSPDLNPFPAGLFVTIFRHLKLKLLTQFSASNDEKYDYLRKIDISSIEVLD